MYQVPQNIDSNKIFIVQRSEVEGRLDPKMALYNRKVQHSLYPKAKLKDLLICKPQYGAGEPGIERKSMSEPRYIRITDIDENGLISYDDLGATANVVEDKYILNENDILIARSGATVGKVYIHKPTSFDCFFAGYLIRFIIDKNKALPSYVFSFTQLNAYKNWVNAIQRPSGQPNINSEEYQSLEIPLPDMTKQQEIVDIIKSAYSQKKQKESEAQQLLNSIDSYLLNELGISLPEIKTDLRSRMFLVNRSDLQDRLDPFYIRYSNNNIYSSKYNTEKLGKIASIVKGNSLTSNNVIPGNIPVIAGGQSSPYCHNVSNFQGNVITVSASGAYAGYVWYHGSPIYATDCNVIYSNNEGFATTQYISEIMKLQQNRIYNLQSGAAQPHVYPDDLRKIIIPIPPLSQQKEITSHITATRQQATRLQEEGKAILENAKKEVERMIIG